MATATWGRSLAEQGAAAVLPRPPGDPSPMPPERIAPPWTVCYAWTATPPVEHPAYTYTNGADGLAQALKWALGTIGSRPHEGLARTAVWIADADGTWTRVQTRCGWTSGGCT